MQHIHHSILLSICLTVLFASFVGAQERQSSDLFQVKVNGKYGFINKKGQIIIEPQFDGVDNFSDGLAGIYVRGEEFSNGFIDETGKLVIQPQFDISGKFSEGFAWVGFDPEKTAYKLGNLTLYTSQSSHSFNYNIGFIDKMGKFITEPIFSFARDFSEDVAVVRTKDNKFGFIDKSGKFVIEAKFDWANSFSEGLALVFVSGKYGFIDKTGKMIIEPQFTKAESFSEGLACVKIGGRVRAPSFGDQIITTTNADTNYAYIDKTGKIIFRIEAGEVHSFSEGLARFEKLGKYGYGFVDKNGKIAIKPEFGGQSDFSNGLKFVILDEGKLGFIDKTGNVALRPNFGNLDDFLNGLARVCASYDFNAKCGYIDKTGKVIWQPTK